MTKSSSDLLDHLAVMYRIRMFENEVKRLKALGEVSGSIHLCNGQEAIYAGAAAALDLPTDLVFCTYRGHGWAIACGVPPLDLFAELLGREAGVNGGRGGSAYLSSPRHGMMGENSIVGAGAPIALGAAIASRFDGSNRVVLTAFGEGALNQGSVHEAMNFAAVRSAPMIFLVENNGWSELTATSSMVNGDRLFKRAASYGIRGVRVDGNHVEDMYETVRQAAAHVREGHGPVVIEAMTERLEGHYIGDVQSYRTAAEIEALDATEPIAALRRRLAAVVPEATLEDVHDLASSEIEAASAAALAGPTADPSTVGEHLYA